jgi:two-component system phosphate regulon sensor histidine kinase PhoR
MWRSPLFWRLFGAYSLIVLAAVMAFGMIVAGHAERPAWVWAVSAIAGLAGLGLSYLLARRTVLPLQELTEAAEQIGAGGYGRRVYGITEADVGTLAQSFNRMSERLAEQFAKLEGDRQQLRAVLGGMVEGVVAVDAEQRVLFVNERAAALLEFASAAPAGRKFWEVVRQRSLQELVARALNSQQEVTEELTWSSSPSRSLTVHAAPLPGSPSRGAVLVLHDTSELRRLERMRQDFVANVSHELKTPLAVITACVETLLDGAADDPEHRGQFLERIADQTERLHALILDLLSLAHIEAGTEVFTFQAVSVRGAVAACLERQRARADAKNQTLELVEGTDDPSVWADEEAVSQILDNLVDNAVKYTPAHGTIRVGWTCEPSFVCLSVSDTGIGIAEEDLPRIFERFYRVDRARSRELGGTGLGLSIVKHLAQAMQGTVWATSQLGGGSTFYVRLPRAQPDES